MADKRSQSSYKLQHQFNQTITGRSASKLENILDQSIHRIEASAENLRHLKSVRELNEMVDQRLVANEAQNDLIFQKEISQQTNSTTQVNKYKRLNNNHKFATQADTRRNFQMQFDKRRRTGVESAIDEAKQATSSEFNNPLSKKIG